MTASDLTSDPLDRRQFGRKLWLLADLVQAADRRRSFRARAFHSAVWSLDELPADLDAGPEEMSKVKGIGPGVARLIAEFRDTGTLAELEHLAAHFPLESARLARLPRMNPTRLQALKALGVDTTADLLGALDAGATSTIEGIGPATTDRWMEILSLPPAPGAVPAHRGAVTAGRLRSHLTGHLPGDEVRVAGAVRRLEEWVERIDLVVATEDPARLARFLEETAVVATSAVEPGWAVDMVTHDRIPVAVRMTEPDSLGTALIRWTGPDEHVEAVGLADGHSTEEQAYAAAGWVWVPPPARAAEPPGRLVELDDIRGDLHLHSDWSPDGHMTIETIVAEALDRGYEYIALTDHTIGLRFGGLDPEALERQAEELARTRKRFPDLHLLHGAEVNVDRVGDLDLDPETLSRLDFAVAGCHSHFDLPKAEQTRRLIRAVQNPVVRVLAHPGGRRIGIRPGFRLDLPAVFEAAAAAGTALEVNGHRDRMDLWADSATGAARAGVLLVADSDAHRVLEMDNMAVAVGVIQRAGLRPDQVLNTRPHEEFLAWLAD